MGWQVSIPFEIEELEKVEAEETTFDDRLWVVIVWDDPVNLMNYVVYVFQKLFGYSREKAEQLMMAVHKEGKAAVSSGSRDEAERDVSKLHAYGLWATMAKE